MSLYTLPAILKVEYIECEELTLYPQKLISPGDTISVIGTFKNLNLTEPSSCNITSERTDNGLVYTTKVSGIIYDDKNSDLQHRLQTKFHNYRLTDSYLDKYLVGIDDIPYPEILFSPVNSASPTGMRAVNFEITWISTLPPIDIIDL